MGHLSIRNMPEHLERQIAREARRRHTSKTVVVLEYLERGVRAAQARPSIRAWAGKLTRRDLDRVLRSSREHRIVDDELWST